MYTNALTFPLFLVSETSQQTALAPIVRVGFMDRAVSVLFAETNPEKARAKAETG